MSTRTISISKFLCASGLRFGSMLGACAVLLTAPVVMRAQSNADGYIYGQVKGAAANADLVATNLDTGLKRATKTDGKSGFRFASLPTGRYTVTLKAPGRAEEVSDVVSVTAGTGTLVRFDASGTPADAKILLEKVTVTAGAISPIDVSSTESVTIFRAETITQLPVGRNLSSVALLAPGTTSGVNAFGSNVSFGGSSVAENAYFVNGFNTTSFRNGLSYATVPFEFYDNFQVKTGGYSAEFGRSTGGLQNSTTKRGSNKWELGVSAYWSPDAFQSQPPSLYFPNNTPGTPDGTIAVNRANRESWSLNGNVSAGGPLIKNKLFFFGLYNVRQSFSETPGITTLSRTWDKDPFWGGKLDWNITDKHTLELTAFSDKATNVLESFVYDYPKTAITSSKGLTQRRRGGETYIARYNGVFSDHFSLSLLAGQGETQTTDLGAGDAFPYIVEGRVGAARVVGKSTSAQPGTSEDKRKVYRIDAEYALGAHRFRFGVDREDTTLFDLTQYSGGVYWRYYRTTVANTRIANGFVVPAAGTEYVRKGVYENGGSFQTISTAIYLEDNWKLLNDRLLLNLGVRNEAFDNRNVNGATFIKIKNQLAPRLGASFDVNKDSKSKIFATYGRYHLPIAANTNLRLAGGELFYYDYYLLNSVSPAPDLLPTLGAQIGPRTVNSDGTVKDPKQIVDHNIKPMYQDEFIVGYQRALNKQWTVGVRGIWRNLLSSIEDVAIDETVNAYARANGIPASRFNAGGNDYYVLTNPGQPMTVTIDFNDGKGARDVTFSKAELKYPKSQRYYAAAEVFFEKIHDGKWFLQGSYTLSRSYGNNEGYVRSDNGQTDAGLTTLFDHPGLMDGAYGDLPNDHRHKFKLFGSYNVNSQFQVGSNLSLTSGMPVNAFGFHPTDPFALAYGVASFYENRKLVPRGSRGRTDWITQWNLNLRYRPKWAGKHMTFGADIFNVLNLQHATEVTQSAEKTGVGTPEPLYRLPSVYQGPRSVRLSVDLKF
jgi:hypothetical protein